MPKHPSLVPVPVTVLAQRVLDVCITNDNDLIETELKKILHLARPSAMGLETGMESERQDFIRAIAARMNRQRKQSRSVVQDSRFPIWVDLLRHLSAGESASAAHELSRAN